jgi:hypothetical protein
MSISILAASSVEGRGRLTNLIKHLVALIENEDLDAAEAKDLVADKGVETTWSTDDDVWVLGLIGQKFSIGLDWSSTIEDTSSDFWHVLAESGILVLDLVGQLTSVAHDKD